jgi:hypothetical protein
MKRFLAFMILGLFALPAMAQGPWYAKGEFNGWSTDNLMTQDPQNSIHWSTTVGGLFDNQTFEYKLATADWSQSAPGGNGKVTSNAAGAITFNMWDQQTWTDGWFPNNQRRVGYADPLEYGWDLMGSFDGFSTGLPMVNQGNGLYSVQAPFNAGFYDFKFRKAGDWNVNMGTDFSNGSGNNSFAVGTTGDIYRFNLDLPNGRWQVVPVSVYQHGDYNADGFTNSADYVLWRKSNSGNAAKYTEWRNNYGYQAVLTWLAHGTFGNDVTLTDQGGGLFTSTLSGLTPGTGYDVQVLRSDASSHWPGSPAKITADAAGNINLKFYQLSGASWGDGWQPDTLNRVGYQDSGQFGWEVIGAFNGWPGTDDPNYNLTDQGNGVYTGSFLMPTAGTYDFKFRKQGDWGTSIGNDFGNSAGNNNFTVAADGDRWNFEIDLPHGKWRAYHPASGLTAGAVPEPTSFVLAMLGFAFVGFAQRR